MAIAAKFSGECPHCGRAFLSGTMIEKRGNKWYPIDCPGCEAFDEGVRVHWDLHRRMMEKYRISYGLYGLTEHIPASEPFENIIDAINHPDRSIKTTGSPEEFLEACIQHNEATDDEIRIFRRHFAGYMRMDLYD
jgi:hypothetical protein